MKVLNPSSHSLLGVPTLDSIVNNQEIDTNIDSIAESSTGNHSNKLNSTTLRDYLRTKNIVVSLRYGYIRIAPYLYNTSADVETLCGHITDFLTAEYK